MMAQNQAGITALITAYARAYHATHDNPKIFDDYLADQYYTAEEHTTFDGHLAKLVELVDPPFAASQPEPVAALARVMQLHNGPITLSRSRYTEDCLDEALRQGVRQYVILGAGFDTFAFRHQEAPTGLQVFEVDHPVTQGLKRQRIEMAGWQLPAHLHFVPIDFTSEKLSAALGRSAYDPRQLSFFSWLGVTYYLSREVVFDTLREIAGLAPAGSRVVFDYIDADGFIPEKAGRRLQLMQSIASQVGEPMQAGFDPRELPAELARLGFRLEEELAPAEIEARYFHNRADDYHAFEHVHFSKVVII